MTALLGYCDPISAAPGERVRFMVSCIGAEPLRRRDRPPDQPAGRTARDPVPDRARSRPRSTAAIPGAGRRSTSARSASSTPTRRSAGSRASRSRPTSGRPRPGGAGRRCSAPGRRARGGASASASTQRARSSSASATASRSRAARPRRPLLARRWYLVAGSFDAASGRLALWQAPVARPVASTTSRRRRSRARPRCARRPARALPVRRLARRARRRRRPPTAGWSWAGTTTASSTGRGSRTARSRAAEIAALAGDGALPSGLERALVARWDFAREIPTETLVDTSPNRLHGAHGQPAGARDDRAQLDRRGDGLDPGARAVRRDPLPRRRPASMPTGRPTSSSRCRTDLRSGVYAARLSAQRGRVLRAVLRPPARAARRRAKIAYLAATATYLRLHQQPRPLRLARDRALPRPADRDGCGRRPAAGVSRGRALDLRPPLRRQRRRLCLAPAPGDQRQADRAALELQPRSVHHRLARAAGRRLRRDHRGGPALRGPRSAARPMPWC